MSSFQTNTVRTGHSLCPFAGKANRETDRAQCSHWPTTRALQLIYSHSCLFIEGEGTAFFISWKETKKPASADRNRPRSVRQNGRSRNWRWQTQCCLHLKGQGCGGKRGRSCTQGPPYTAQDGAGFCGGVAKGLCHRSHQCVVTYLSNKKKKRHFSAAFRRAARWQGLWNLKHYRGDVSLK